MEWALYTSLREKIKKIKIRIFAKKKTEKIEKNGNLPISPNADHCLLPIDFVDIFGGPLGEWSPFKRWQKVHF